MYNWYIRLKKWYFKLPWYWKILGFLILVLIFLLLILSVLFNSKEEESILQKINNLQEIDALQENRTNKKLREVQKKGDEIKQKIIQKKVEMNTKINTTTNLDKQAIKRRDEITKATTMEELDKIQEKYKL